MEMLGFLIDLKCDENLWDLVKASRNGPAFSHLFFANDLVLFARADMKNCCNVKETLDTFYELSGQKVSLAKSKVYFSPNIRQEERDEMCEVLGMRSTPNLGKYLGFPLKHPGSSSHDFDFVLERVQTKVQGWTASLLSMVGRVVLTQFVTLAVPSYLMQGCFLPSRVLNGLDRLNRNFIWGSTEEKKKMHLICGEKNYKTQKPWGFGCLQC